MPSSHYEDMSIGDIKPYANNPRSRSLKQKRALQHSIQQYGFNAPIVVDEDGVIINGEGRYEAARELGLATVRIVRVVGLTEAQKRAYRIADNKVGAMSMWDTERLAIEVDAILEAGLEVEVATAFSTAEIDIMLGTARDQRGPDVRPEDRLPHKPGARAIVSQRGDVWRLGNHRLMCGDARDPADMQKLLAGELASMVFTDPPYNVPIPGFVMGKGATKHADFVMAAGEMSPSQFTEFLETTLGAMAEVCRDGAILFVCMDWRHIIELLTAGARVGLKLMNLIVWAKTNGGMGTFYRSRHELIFAFKKGEASHTNNFELGQEGRYRTNVWEYRGANAFGPTRDEDLASHPTVKPALMVADAIKDVSHRGGIVLDTFGGSGTTLIAAHMTGRRARVMEIDPAYVDVAVRRWQIATGKKATLVGSTKTFEEQEEARAARATDGGAQ